MIIWEPLHCNIPPQSTAIFTKFTIDKNQRGISLVSANEYSTVFAKFNKDHSATRKEFAELTLIVIQISVVSGESTLCAVALKLDGRAITANICSRIYEIELVLRPAWKPAQIFRAIFPWSFPWETRLSTGRISVFRVFVTHPRPRGTPSFGGIPLPWPCINRSFPGTTFLALGTTVPVTANLSNLPQLRSP